MRGDIERRQAVGHKFTLILSREITDGESAILQEAGCAGAIFAKDSLPTNADVPVTKMDFDDTVSPSLAEAIESALEAVKKMPDLSVPGLTVPAQPAQPQAEEVAEDSAVATEDKPAARKPAAKKPSTKRTSAKKATATPDPVEAAAGSD
jgi:hypothetical protein